MGQVAPLRRKNRSDRIGVRHASIHLPLQPNSLAQSEETPCQIERPSDAAAFSFWGECPIRMREFLRASKVSDRTTFAVGA